MTINGMSADSLEKKSASILSIHVYKCKKLGLDPEKTSTHVLQCVERCLDPEKTSMHALACKKLGLDPEKTSINDLKNAGSKLYK